MTEPRKARRNPRAFRAALLFALAAFALVLGSQGSALAKPKPKKPVVRSQATEEVVAEPEPESAPVAPLSVAPAEPDADPASDGGSTKTADTPSAAVAAPAEAPAAPSVVASTTVDPKLGELRDELSQVMDELVAARARAAVVGKSLFKTRVVVKVQNLAGPDPVLGKVVLKMDGLPVFRGDGTQLPGDAPHTVYEGFITPGKHSLVVDVEQRARGNADFGYALHETYRFVVKGDNRTDLLLVLDDDSDLAEDFADDGEGEYDVRTRLRVKSHPLPTP